MTFTGLTDPKAVEIDGNPYVQFEDGKVVECQTTEEAEALAEAWRQWPYSPHPPVEQSRGQWRTGFAAGAAWQASQSPRPESFAAEAEPPAPESAVPRTTEHTQGSAS
jgi:hypothetical protein